MFESLKKKISSFTEKISSKFKKEEKKEEKEGAKEIKEEKKPEKKEEKKQEVKHEEKKEEEIEAKEEKKIEQEPKGEKHEEKKKIGFLQKLTKKKISEEDIDSGIEELELLLLENNVAAEVIERIKTKLKEDLAENYASRKNFTEFIKDSLKKSISEVLIEEDIDEFKKKLKSSEKPIVFLVLGINGVGKTTSLAKFAKWLQKNDMTSVIAAADTFRAASLEQLEKHADNLGVKLIKHQYGADAAAVAFDAIQYAKSKGIDCVLIDTAGRSHTNANLMDELKKIIRVSKPNYRIFVGDSMTGNDAVEQARTFGEAAGIDFSILAKADCDQKGGAILSVAYVTGKPIMFLGTGEGYEDLIPFSKTEILKKLGLE